MQGRQVDGSRYVSVSEQLLDISMNKSTAGKMDRQALEKRLMELQGDVSRLVTKLSNRAKDDSQSHRAAVMKLAESTRVESIHVPEIQKVYKKKLSKHPIHERNIEIERSPPLKATTISKTQVHSNATKSKVLKHSNSTSSIPGSRLGNMIRLQSDLHAAQLTNDKLRFDIDQMRRALESQEFKLRDYQRLQNEHKQLHDHCTSLQQSLDLSEAIRQRQKKKLDELQRTRKQSNNTSLEILDNQQEEDDNDSPGIQVEPYNSMDDFTLQSTHKTKKKKRRIKTKGTFTANCSFLAPTQASTQRRVDTKQFRQQTIRR